MRIVLTGANGQLGSALIAQCAEIEEIELLALDHKNLDITNKQAVKDSLSFFRPQFVINAAAYTAVDQAEKEPEKAFAVNRDGASHVALACSQLDIPMIHLSTDYVFDGQGHEPYSEHDKINPINIYGRSKWEGEEAIRRFLKRHIILRVSWLFGYYGNNFVKTILKLAAQRKELRIVADQIGCPTFVNNLAEVILQILGKVYAGQTHWGTYHYCNQPATSWHEFACEIIRLAKAEANLAVAEVLPIPTVEYPTPAQRPHYSVLNCKKIAEVFGIYSTDWRDELPELVRSLSKTSPVPQKFKKWPFVRIFK